MWSHTVAILIGGESKRMGEPKHLVRLPSGMTMLETMLSFAEETAASTVIVGGEVKPYNCILDKRAKCGPVAGIEALLDSDLDSEYLVVGCDMPELQAKHVELLLTSTCSAAYSFEGRTLGLPIRITTDTLAMCTAYLDSGQTSIRGFFCGIPHTTVALPQHFSQSITSINSKEDVLKIYGAA